MSHNIFLQHLVLALISAGSAITVALIAARLNRKMTRLEIKVNGRIDQLLKQTEAPSSDPERNMKP